MVAPAKRKPPAAGMGRKKGVPNKMTAAIKDMVRRALDGAGGVAYLVRMADEQPVAFMGLVGKLLPLDVNHGAQDSLSDLMRALDGRTRGLPGSR